MTMSIGVCLDWQCHVKVILLIRFDKSRQPVMGWLQRTFERNNAHKTACFACRLRQPLAKKDGPNIQQIVYHVQQCFYRLPADARLLVVS